MTKAEQKKKERKEKIDFINVAAKEVLKSIGKYLDDSARKCTVRLSISNSNRYFSFHRYCDDLSICIYQSGDIDFHFKEGFHSDIDMRVVHYETVPDDPKAVLEQLRTDVDLVVHSYLQYDWHCFMDYQWGSKNGDWRDKTRLFLKECKGL